MRKTVTQAIAGRLAAIANCEKSGNAEWQAKHAEALAALVADHLPSGSGFDSGTTLDGDSTPDKLRFETSFHHMNGVGVYDGWTDHVVTVRPSFVYTLDITVSGRNQNDIKDYIAESFIAALSAEIED